MTVKHIDAPSSVFDYAQGALVAQVPSFKKGLIPCTFSIMGMPVIDSLASFIEMRVAVRFLPTPYTLSLAGQPVAETVSKRTLFSDTVARQAVDLVNTSNATLGGNAYNTTDTMRMFNYLSYATTNTNYLLNFPEMYPGGTLSGLKPTTDEMTLGWAQVITLRLPLQLVNPLFQVPYIFVNETNNLQIQLDLTFNNPNELFFNPSPNEHAASVVQRWLPVTAPLYPGLPPVVANPQISEVEIAMSGFSGLMPLNWVYATQILSAEVVLFGYSNPIGNPITQTLLESRYNPETNSISDPILAYSHYTRSVVLPRGGSVTVHQSIGNIMENCLYVLGFFSNTTLNALYPQRSLYNGLVGAEVSNVNLKYGNSGVPLSIRPMNWEALASVTRQTLGKFRGYQNLNSMIFNKSAQKLKEKDSFFAFSLEMTPNTGFYVNMDNPLHIELTLSTEVASELQSVVDPLPDTAAATAPAYTITLNFIAVYQEVISVVLGESMTAGIVNIENA